MRNVNAGKALASSRPCVLVGKLALAQILTRRSQWNQGPDIFLSHMVPA